MKEFIFHGIIQKEEDRHTAICLELDIATEGELRFLTGATLPLEPLNL